MKSFYSHALSVLLILLFVSCENRYRKNLESNNSNSNLSTSASESKQKVDIAKDAYQVSSDEYDEYFITRYGLLYQKFSDSPFTGRIVTNESGPDGKFVIADDSWRNGKKDGTSTRWFSNGIKMYERNYTEGKWNGTVTRWWPNGQKMYVRAYSDGVRHGKEATWRSDGTPIKTASIDNATPTVPVSESAGENVESQPITTEPPVSTELPSVDLPIISDIPSQPVAPVSDSSVLPNTTLVPETDSPEFPEVNGVVENPTLEPNPNDLPGLPGLPAEPESSDDLPGLPGLPETSNDLPPMPAESDDALPGLPPLPATDGDGDLDGGLPPLPPLP